MPRGCKDQEGKRLPSADGTEAEEPAQVPPYLGEAVGGPQGTDAQGTAARRLGTDQADEPAYPLRPIRQKAHDFPKHMQGGRLHSRKRP